MTQKSCKERIREELRGRIQDLEKIFRIWQNGDEEVDPDLGSFGNYGLSFDYVPKGTFEKQRRGYFRYQLSWGGPGDEFRFFVDETFEPVRIEYWFLDWFDGARIVLTGKDTDLLREIWDDFKEVGTVEQAYKEASN